MLTKSVCDMSALLFSSINENSCSQKYVLPHRTSLERKSNTFSKSVLVWARIKTRHSYVTKVCFKKWIAIEVHQCQLHIFVHFINGKICGTVSISDFTARSLRSWNRLRNSVLSNTVFSGWKMKRRLDSCKLNDLHVSNILDFVLYLPVPERNFNWKAFILSSNDVTKLFTPYTCVQFKAQPAQRLHINNPYYIAYRKLELVLDITSNSETCCTPDEQITTNCLTILS